MKNYGLNPYLPSWEYVPDGEPHVFGERVYVYGSHDRFNGYNYCLNDYVCWSASVEDLTNWNYEGVIYSRHDDPENKDGKQCLYAPDVTRGPDGRYYLYYALDGTSQISVAVCETPAGRYQFYGIVHHPHGIPLGAAEGDEFQFDPGVLTEGEHTYLYTGFSPVSVPGRSGARVVVLGTDMLTVVKDAVTVVPSPHIAKSTDFEGHAFFEASSIRKVNGRYYFIYSSEQSHELCYATSDSPVGLFTYGGTIVSNGDIGLTTNGKDSEQNLSFIGNNHGSIEEINGKWYVFYHRHTNGHNYSRQACLEPINILPDGSIPQVEISSCGPMGGPLSCDEEIPSYAACNLYLTEKPRINTRFGMSPFPRITQAGQDETDPTIFRENAYITNITSGVVIGFKYIDCKMVHRVCVQVRGQNYGGSFAISTAPDAEPLGFIKLNSSNEWHWDSAELQIPDGIHALYFKLTGFGIIDFLSFKLV